MVEFISLEKISDNNNISEIKIKGSSKDTKTSAVTLVTNELLMNLGFQIKQFIAGGTEHFIWSNGAQAKESANNITMEFLRCNDSTNMVVRLSVENDCNSGCVVSVNTTLSALSKFADKLASFNASSGKCKAILNSDKVTSHKIKTSIAAIFGTIAGLIVLSLIIYFASGAAFETSPEKFNYDELSIVLTDDFILDKELKGIKVYFSEDTVVRVYKDDFSDMGNRKNLSVKEYGELIIELNKLTGKAKVVQEEGLTYFRYKTLLETTNKTVYNFTTIYKSKDAFWRIEFLTYEEDIEEQYPQIRRWAKSVTFDE